MAGPSDERQATDSSDGRLLRHNYECKVSDRVAQRPTAFTHGSQPLLLHRTDELNDVMVRAGFERISRCFIFRASSEAPGSRLRVDRSAAKLQFVLIRDVFDREDSRECGCFLVL